MSSGGFALLVVIMALGLLALFGAELTASSRSQLRAAMLIRDEAAVQAAADGAVRQAIFNLLTNPGGPVGNPMRFRIGDAAVVVSIEDEATKINPNAVPREVLRAVMLAVGIDPPNAARLAAEVVDWRGLGRTSVLGGPKVARYRELGLPYGVGNHAFSSVDELGLVADMTPEVLARLRPWLSVHQESDVTPGSDQTPVAETIRDLQLGGKQAPLGQAFISRNRVFRVTAFATMRGRTQFTRSVVVRLRHDASATTAPGAEPDAHSRTNFVQILEWN